MDERARNRPSWQVAVRLTVAALVWSIGLVLAALLLGSYSGQTVSSDTGVTLTTRTFVQVNGLGSLVLVAMPAAGGAPGATASSAFITSTRPRTKCWRSSPAA